MGLNMESVEGLVGRTPLLKIRRILPPDSAELFAKMEFFNPGGSVKDRIALAMIDEAERQGILKPGSTIIEPTSGNTGLGLAMIGAARRYRVIVVLCQGMSFERQKLLEGYGTEVILTPADWGMKGAVEKAENLVAQHPDYYMPQQFNNPANPEAHRRTTGPEILEGLQGRPVDALVVGVGTGGTITGVGEVLKKSYPQMKVIAVEPATSAILSGHAAGPHQIQGIGAGFIPQILNREIIDEVIPVSDEDAFSWARKLAHEEGIAVGISSGAACCAAVKVARRLGTGKTVVTLFADANTRYLSTALFD